MPRKPDYKRDKKLREAAQRKRNEQTQQRKAARKSLAAGEAASTEAEPTKPGLP
jgi:hypothetical protein